MNKTEHGVLQPGKLAHLLTHILLLLTFCLSHPAYAETPVSANILPGDTQKHHVFIIYSPDSALQSNIAQKLSENLNLKRSNIIISKVTPEEEIKTVNNDIDVIIGIGSAGIKSADKHYPKTNKLFISTDPEKHRLDTNKNKSDAILYMTQPYCRQIRFIKLINENWKTIGILSSRKKPVDTKTIQQCANKYDMKIHAVNTEGTKYLTRKIKTALNNSDILLALPDKNIYNSETVKNILLTSYRYRKPVIAFSKNFVNAGALASIYSSTEQIAQSASTLIDQYFDLGKRFKRSINHPQSFDISINRQVFKALNLSIPDIDKLKQSIEYQESDKSGKLQ